VGGWGSITTTHSFTMNRWAIVSYKDGAPQRSALPSIAARVELLLIAVQRVGERVMG